MNVNTMHRHLSTLTLWLDHSFFGGSPAKSGEVFTTYVCVVKEHVTGLICNSFSLPSASSVENKDTFQLVCTVFSCCLLKRV